MRPGWWDSFLSTHFDGDGGGGGGGTQGDEGDKGKGGGNGNNAKDPPWKSEFGDNFDPEKAWDLIQNMRRTERTLKKERDDAQGKVKEYDDKDKSELERLQAANKELADKVTGFEAAEKKRQIATVISTEAGKAGALYPDDIFKLIDESDLEISDDGKVKNAEKVIANLKEARPALFGRTQSADGNKGRNGGSPGGGENGVMNDLIRRGAGRA